MLMKMVDCLYFIIVLITQGRYIARAHSPFSVPTEIVDHVDLIHNLYDFPPCTPSSRIHMRLTP